jgi:predicted DNA-binding transcriptional regulator AlpA
MIQSIKSQVADCTCGRGDIDAALAVSGKRRLITETELAEMWGISPSTIQHWRSTGIGPLYKKLGGKIRYALEDIMAYEEQQTFQGSGERVNRQAKAG